MAGSLNKAQIIGNLGRDPEIRTTQAGEKIANLAVATGEAWTDKATGERKERTEWHRVVSFNDRINDVIEKYLRKGSKVYVEGQLQTRKWTDQAGVEKYSTEIVISRFKGELTMLDTKGASAGAEDASPAPRPSTRQKAPAGGGSIDDDSIPFSSCWQ